MDYRSRLSKEYRSRGSFSHREASIAGNMVRLTKAPSTERSVDYWNLASPQSRIHTVSRRGLSDQQARRLQCFIDESHSRRIYTPELASQACLSESRLFRAFHETFGESPGRYVARCRIKHAQARMRHPSMSLSEIAQVCGFCDQAHFTRTFKRLTGTSPGQWRAGHVGGDPIGTTPEGM